MKWGVKSHVLYNRINVPAQEMGVKGSNGSEDIFCWDIAYSV